MKRRNIAGFGIAAVILTFGISYAFAATDAQSVPDLTASPRKQAVQGMDRQHWELTSAENSEIENLRAQREAKLESFIQSLSDEQKALYEAMTSARLQQDKSERPKKPDESDMTVMKENREAFIASLTESQKAAYDELIGNKIRQPMEQSDEKRSEMEAILIQHKEKLEAFVKSLSDEQKALYEAMTPTHLQRDKVERLQKPDESDMAVIKEKREAFIASLTESQKAAYDELFGKAGYPFKTLANEQKTVIA